MYDFLTRLRPEFDETRGRILGKEPIPTLNDVFSYICSEEDRRKVMMEPNSQEISALKTEIIEDTRNSHNSMVRLLQGAKKYKGDMLEDTREAIFQ